MCVNKTVWHPGPSSTKPLLPLYWGWEPLYIWYFCQNSALKSFTSPNFFLLEKSRTTTAVLTEWNFLCGSQAELQRSLQAKESSAAAAQEALSEKELELRELKSQKAAEKGLISKEDHEALRLSLQAEINAATARFNDLTRKHEKTCTEVGRARVCERVLVPAHSLKAF